MRRQRSILALIVALALLLSMSAASVSAGGTRVGVFLLTLTGDQEVCAPPAVCNDPNAVAHMILIVIPARNTVCYVTTWRGIDGTVVAAHIHLAPAGVSGPIVITLFSGTFGSNDRTANCVSANGLASAILATPSAYYVNIHSTVYPAGAVRDQLG